MMNAYLKSMAWMLSCLMIIGIAGCDVTDTDTGQEENNLSLRIETVHSPPSGSALASPVTARSEHDSLFIEGSNGTLRIDDIRFIVEKFKFEMEDDGCDDDGDDDDDREEERGCEDFEAEPFFVDLPLGEDTLSLADSRIDTGLYKEMEFEVHDLDFEEDEEEHTALRDSIRSLYAEWPDEASMIIDGRFTGEDGSAESFRVFAKAEIEIEREFEPPLRVTDDNRGKVVSVRINPVRWFSRDDGTVLDLHTYDWERTGELLEFSAKFEDGVEEVDVDDRDEDDDDDDEDDDDD